MLNLGSASQVYDFVIQTHNAELSGDLGVATKEPRKGRPAAIGRELLRLVMHADPPCEMPR